MNIRFMSLALALTTSVAYAGDKSPDRPDFDYAMQRVALWAKNSHSSDASAIYVNPASLPTAEDLSRVFAVGESSSGSRPTPVPATPIISLNKTGFESWHAAAYISWPKGARWQLDAGECAMVVRTDINPSENDTWDLLTVPDRVVNSMPIELTSPDWPISGGDSMRCKAILAGMLTNINCALINENPYSKTIAGNKQRITALAIALAYNGTTYSAESSWNGSDQLVPFISVDTIRETSLPVAIGIDAFTTNPAVGALSSPVSLHRSLPLS